MHKFLGTVGFAAMLLAAPAMADVMVEDKLSGTGDNVVFDSFAGNVAIGSFNGQHQGLVQFTDLSNNPGFIGAASGNDIKISNTNDLQIIVFDTTGTQVLDTSEQVFSLKGSGDVTANVQATDGLFTFDLGIINPDAQSGFTLLATNGESMSELTLTDNGGTISDFEHYRIDVVPGPVLGVPDAPTWATLIAGFGFMVFLKRRRHAKHPPNMALQFD